MAKKNAFFSPYGWIEIICGPMFAGKSEELLRRLKRLEYADVEYLVFKPIVDSRTSAKVQSRMGYSSNAIEIDDPNEILKYLNDHKEKKYRVIAIDEAQFFSNELVKIADILANCGYIVLISGLDCDCYNNPFGPIPFLVAKAEKVTKLSAICTICGAQAHFTQRYIKNKPIVKKNNDDLIIIGDNETYAPRCRACYVFNDDDKWSQTQKEFVKYHKK